MAKLLYIESSPRKERSHSIKVANAFLDAYAQARPADSIDRLDLWAEDIPSFDGAMIDAKYAVMHGQEPTADEQAAWAIVTEWANRFNAADKYLISVPMWNFGIPYRLKQYIDVVTQPGLTWSFDPATGYSGLGSGKAVAVYSSAGVYHDGSGAEAMDLQKPTVENWLAFVGITDVQRVIVAPTLATPEEVSKAGDDACAAAAAIAANF